MFVVILMIVTILYHSYHFCPNYGHSHLLLETMVTVSMIIWIHLGRRLFLQVMVIIGVSEDPPKSQIYFLEIIEIDKKRRLRVNWEDSPIWSGLI